MNAQSLATDDDTLNEQSIPEIKSSQLVSDFTTPTETANKSTPVMRKAKKFGKIYGKWKQGMSKSTHDLTIAAENNNSQISTEISKIVQKTQNNENSISKNVVKSSQVTDNLQILDRDLVYRFIIPLYGYLGQVVPDRSSVVFQTKNAGNLKLNWNLSCSSTYEVCQ